MKSAFFHVLSPLALSVFALFSKNLAAQETWIIGHSAPLTGGNAAFGKDIRDGALAYFNMINARGGVGGKPIQLLSLDDANDRKRAGANTQKMLDENKPIAFFGYASATLSLDAMPLADKAGVLFFAPFSGAQPVRTAPPVVYTLRASYADELEKMLNFWTGFGAKKVVVVHYEDEVGKQNLQVVTDYLKKISVAPQAFSIQRNAVLQAADVERLLGLKPDVIINTVLSTPASVISKHLDAKQVAVPMSSLSFVGAAQYIQAAGQAARGVSIAQVVPNPSLQGVPIVNECSKALVDSGMNMPMNSTQLEACIAAKVLTEAIRRAKSPVNPRSLLASIQSLNNYDTGGFTVSYGAGQNHGSKFVELNMVSRDGKLRK